MIIKKITAAVLGAVMLCSVTASAKTLEFTISSDALYISDAGIEQKTLDAAPYIANGRTMVPLRAVGENFDADVTWNGEMRTATIKTDDVTVELTIDSTEAIVNGKAETLDAAPVIINGRTMVPLRFIGESLHKNVEYVSASSQILINDEEPVMTINGMPITLDDYRFMYLYYNLTEGSYSPEVLVPVISQNIIETASVAADAKAKGYPLHSTQGAELTNSIMSDSDIFYELSLTAPGIKVLSEMLCSMNYVSQNFSYDITDEQIAQEYSSNYVRAKHILIPTIDLTTREEYSESEQAAAKKTADKVYKAAAAGEDFDELIEKYNQDPGVSSSPDGYTFTYGEMVTEFEESAFALEENAISQPVKTPFGYHIIFRLPLGDITDDVKYSIQQSLIQKALTAYVEECIASAGVEYNMTEEEIVENLGISSEDINTLIEKIISEN